MPRTARRRRPRHGRVGERLDPPALRLQQARFGGDDVEVVRQAALVAQLRDFDFAPAEIDAVFGGGDAAHQAIALADDLLHVVGDLALERRRFRAAGDRDR